MNKSIALSSFVVLLVAALCPSAQADTAKKSMKVTTDSALSGVYVPGTGGVGGGIVIEPKIEVASNLRVGLRTAIAISGGGSIDSEDSDVSVGVGVNVAVMAKAEYSLPTKGVRPVFGLGAGMYYLVSQNVSAGDNTSVSQQAGEFVGLAPQVGIEVGRARLAATYNAILGANVEIQQTVGDAKIVRQDYWSVELGMRF